ncbi:hypothetical protein C7M84_004672 [Penaeus vannamei]|uniref:Uncharacterized protein n=1 Tax=Penaeus vannamei TaxID=6689 RepID=A0A423TJU9_PENVA|nr:hypothetical protein C7M84_004672 [Penaeus vannamei]
MREVLREWRMRRPVGSEGLCDGREVQDGTNEPMEEKGDRRNFPIPSPFFIIHLSFASPSFLQSQLPSPPFLPPPFFHSSISFFPSFVNTLYSLSFYCFHTSFPPPPSFFIKSFFFPFLSFSQTPFLASPTFFHPFFLSPQPPPSLLSVLFSHVLLILLLSLSPISSLPSPFSLSLSFFLPTSSLFLLSPSSLPPFSLPPFFLHPSFSFFPPLSSLLFLLPSLISPFFLFLPPLSPFLPSSSLLSPPFLLLLLSPPFLPSSIPPFSSLSSFFHPSFLLLSLLPPSSLPHFLPSSIPPFSSPSSLSPLSIHFLSPRTPFITHAKDSLPPPSKDLLRVPPQPPHQKDPLQESLPPHPHPGQDPSRVPLPPPPTLPPQPRISSLVPPPPCSPTISLPQPSPSQGQGSPPLVPRPLFPPPSPLPPPPPQPLPTPRPRISSVPLVLAFLQPLREGSYVLRRPPVMGILSFVSSYDSGNKQQTKEKRSLPTPFRLNNRLRMHSGTASNPVQTASQSAATFEFEKKYLYKEKEEIWGNQGWRKEIEKGRKKELRK